jgi:hypothetical protein
LNKQAEKQLINYIKLKESGRYSYSVTTIGLAEVAYVGERRVE